MGALGFPHAYNLPIADLFQPKFRRSILEVLYRGGLLLVNGKEPVLNGTICCLGKSNSFGRVRRGLLGKVFLDGQAD